MKISIMHNGKERGQFIHDVQWVNGVILEKSFNQTLELVIRVRLMIVKGS